MIYVLIIDLTRFFRSMCRMWMDGWQAENDCHRFFGTFHCTQCGNVWTSGNAWKGKWQQCENCSKKVRPQELEELEPLSDPNEDREPLPHRGELCERCQELGHSCTYLKDKSERPTPDLLVCCVQCCMYIYSSHACSCIVFVYISRNRGTNEMRDSLRPDFSA